MVPHTEDDYVHTEHTHYIHTYTFIHTYLFQHIILKELFCTTAVCRLLQFAEAIQ